jgi:hypothetical protein
VKNDSKRKIVVLTIILSIAILHIFNPLRWVSGIWRGLYYSYFSDLTLPFGYYFLLCIAEDKIRLIRPWWVKAGGLFTIVLMAEILQFFGYDALGTVYDPIDILMYATGIFLAVLCDLLIFPELFPFWDD